jgi:hypothetical protein
MGHRPAQPPRPDRPGSAAHELLVAALWHGSPTPPGDDVLALALRLARQNRVEALLARAYPDRLAAELREVEDKTRGFRRSLEEVASLLRRAGVAPILIKADPAADYVYSNFDVVVGDDGWDEAVRVLAGWSSRRWGHVLERDKVLFAAPAGPAVHLHRSVAWFEVPVIPTPDLRRRTVADDGHPWLLPDPLDRLRITLAHAAFQNLAVDLADLLEMRSLLTAPLPPQGAERAGQEGWRATFEAASDWAAGLVRRLDAGVAIPLPAPMPAAMAARAGVEHAGHLLGSGRRPLAARELALRPVLIAAKRRQVWSARRRGATAG